jgi:hypothetical protein
MYEDYVLIPLDLPPLPVSIEAMRRFAQTRCEECAFNGNLLRFVLFHARKPVIDGELLLHAADPRMRQVPQGTRFEWDPVFAQSFPDLVAWVDALPFAELHDFSLVTQNASVAEHLDVFGENNSNTWYETYRTVEPMYYRIIFCAENDVVTRSRCFYVTTEFGGERHWVELPAGVNAIAMGGSTCYHGAHHNPGHYKTTGVLYGELDRPRHWDLLGRSLRRYGDLAVRTPRPGPVEGPGAVMPYGGASYHG